MKGFVKDIETLTEANKNFRTVLYTSKHMQLVLMSLPPAGEIGEEVHTDNDQFFRVESGTGTVLIDGNEYAVKAGDAIIVPAGAKHNVVNASATDVFSVYTIYSPPHHRDGVIHATKEAAANDEEAFDGVTSE